MTTLPLSAQDFLLTCVIAMAPKQSRIFRRWERLCVQLQQAWYVAAQALAALAVLSLTPTIRNTALTLTGAATRMKPIVETCERTMEAMRRKKQTLEQAAAKCEHWDYTAKQGKGETACKIYGAGRAGRFSRCRLCNARWRWDEEAQSWEWHPDKESSQLPLPSGVGTTKPVQPTAARSKSATAAPPPRRSQPEPMSISTPQSGVVHIQNLQGTVAMGGRATSSLDPTGGGLDAERREQAQRQAELNTQMQAAQQEMFMQQQAQAAARLQLEEQTRQVHAGFQQLQAERAAMSTQATPFHTAPTLQPQDVPQFVPPPATAFAPPQEPVHMAFTPVGGQHLPLPPSRSGSRSTRRGAGGALEDSPPSPRGRKEL